MVCYTMSEKKLNDLESQSITELTIVPILTNNAIRKIKYLITYIEY